MTQLALLLRRWEVGRTSGHGASEEGNGSASRMVEATAGPELPPTTRRWSQLVELVRRSSSHRRRADCGRRCCTSRPVDPGRQRLQERAEAVLVELSVVEQRYHAVMEVAAGVAVTQVAARYGVSRQSVHSWVRKYEQSGLPGLADRSHRPASCPHRSGANVEAAVCELPRRHPGWGPRRLVHELERRRVLPAPSRATVYRCWSAAAWCSQGCANGVGRITAGGSGKRRWSCGRWTSWAGCCWPTGPSASCHRHR